MRSGLSAALLMVAFAAVFSALYGCGQAEVTDRPPRYVKPSEEQQVSQLGQGGTVRVALPESMEPECLNPYLAACHGAGSLSGILFEGLLTPGPRGEYRTVLAAETPSYGAGTLTLEPTSVEVTVRENAAFSDGEPVTAEDVAWTYGRATELARSGGISPVYSGFRRVEGVEAVGDRAVRVTFDGTYSEWRDVLSAPVLPEHVHGDSREQRGLASLSLNDAPVGSGPFLIGAKKENGIEFTASPRYWMDALELPRLDGLEVEYRGAREAAGSLATDRADFGLFPVARDLPDSGDLLRSDAARTRTEAVVFNSARLDKDTREAASDALDREGISSGVGFNAARSVFPSSFTGEESGPWSASGDEPPTVPEGTELSVVYPSGGPVRDAVVDGISGQLRDAGFAAEVRRVLPSEFFGGTLPAGDFDLAVWDFGSLPEYDALAPLLSPAASAAVSGVFEASEDRGRYVAATERVLADESSVVPLFVWPESYAWSSTLSGPADDVPERAFAWNVREWAFYK